jgi:hypothetical protein
LLFSLEKLVIFGISELSLNLQYCKILIGRFTNNQGMGIKYFKFSLLWKSLVENLVDRFA